MSRPRLLLLIDRGASPEVAQRIKDQLAELVGMPVVVIAGGRQALIVNPPTEDTP
jgi:delta 1-pyrroline-5-carboxylate dehydrogenase